MRWYFEDDKTIGLCVTNDKARVNSFQVIQDKGKSSKVLAVAGTYEDAQKCMTNAKADLRATAGKKRGRKPNSMLKIVQVKTYATKLSKKNMDPTAIELGVTEKIVRKHTFLF